MKASILKVGALIAGIALLGWSALPQQVDDAWWVDRNYPAVFNDFFPIDHAQGDFIAVRAHRDVANNETRSDYMEFSVVIENTDKPSEMRGILRDGIPPIYDELKYLHNQYPKKTYAELEKDVKVVEWEFSLAQCPAVAAQYKAFENITFVRPRDDDAEDEHPVMYQFHESVGGGDSEVMEFVESRAFPKWANETHKAFEDCVSDSVTPTRAVPANTKP